MLAGERESRRRTIRSTRLLVEGAKMHREKREVERREKREEKRRERTV